MTPGLTSSLRPSSTVESAPCAITPSACCTYDALNPIANSSLLKSTSSDSLASPVSGLVDETVNVPAESANFTPGDRSLEKVGARLIPAKSRSPLHGNFELDCLRLT